ncbi:MAG: pyruvate synthase, partial [Eubacterium sp.]|nr:pyruvate synthase [Eubacterium sp.]
VATTGVMPKETFLHEMRASYKHKFAKKPEVIDGNMKALEMAFAAVEEA